MSKQENNFFINSNSWKKRALITGVTGQIGSYLAELLIDKGYDVFGIIRRTSHVKNARQRIDHLKNLNLFYGDLQDSGVIERIISEVQPDEIYNLAAQSHVGISFDTPEHTSNVNALGVLRICEAAKRLKKPVRVYQASTSELFGGTEDGILLNENSNFKPKSPYAVAKLYGYWIIRNYREAYGMFCCNGIIFNSESPRRGENFVTKKITKGVADIISGKTDKIYLGNLNAKRDWSHAKDSAKAMWMILQSEKPEDYVIASGETHSVREFVEEAFKHVGIEIGWRGEGLEEMGYDKRTNRVYVAVNPYYFRPSEVDILVGDASNAKKKLGWTQEYSFKELVKEMVEADLNESSIDLGAKKDSFWPKEKEKINRDSYNKKS